MSDNNKLDSNFTDTLYSVDCDFSRNLCGWKIFKERQTNGVLTQWCGWGGNISVCTPTTTEIIDELWTRLNSGDIELEVIKEGTCRNYISGGIASF